MRKILYIKLTSGKIDPVESYYTIPQLDIGSLHVQPLQISFLACLSRRRLFFTLAFQEEGYIIKSAGSKLGNFPKACLLQL